MRFNLINVYRKTPLGGAQHWLWLSLFLFLHAVHVAVVNSEVTRGDNAQVSGVL
jgi:hypothetical protein